MKLIQLRAMESNEWQWRCILQAPSPFASPWWTGQLPNFVNSVTAYKDGTTAGLHAEILAVSVHNLRRGKNQFNWFQSNWLPNYSSKAPVYSILIFCSCYRLNQYFLKISLLPKIAKKGEPLRLTNTHRVCWRNDLHS